MKVLIVGWFSWEGSDWTAGDYLASELAREWLESAGYRCDVARAPASRGGVDLKRVDPGDYSHAVFVCGPFMRNHWEAEFLGRFARCGVVGLNLTLPVPLDVWNPFDALVERDSSAAAHPDITFLSTRSLVPVVGVCLVEPYDGALVAEANAAIGRPLAGREVAVVPIDTRLDVNATGLRTAAEIESLLARMDAVVTTRLHGTVLALKNGVPALAIDPEPGGAKIMRQAEVIGWPVAFPVDRLTPSALDDALDFCLTPAARTNAWEGRERAIVLAEDVRRAFLAAIESTAAPGAKRLDRSRFAASYRQA